MSVTAIQGVTLSTVRTEMESVTSAQALWLQNWEVNKLSEVDENGVAGMIFVADPVVVSLPNGKIYCFGTGLDSKVHQKWFNPSTSTWSAWASTGKSCHGAPVAIGWATNRVAVFVIGFDRLVYAGLKSTTSDTEYSWTILSGATDDSAKRVRSGSLSAIPYDGRILVVVIEQTTGKLIHQWLDSNIIWQSSWTTLDSAGSTYCMTSPVMISCKAMTVDVFILGEDYGLKRMTCRAAGWSTWVSVSPGSVFQYTPAAISVSTGRIEVFTLSTVGDLFRWSVTLVGNEVGTLVLSSPGIVSISPPMALIISPGVFAVTTKKAKGVWQQKFYESSTGVWTPKDGAMVVSST